MNLSKTSKNNWSCILCGGIKREIFYKEKRLPKSKISFKEAVCTGEIGARGKHAKIWRCLGCGLIFQEPSFSQNELDEAYLEGVDEQYFEQLEQRKNLFRKCLKRIGEFKNPKGKLLDVGSGAGIFVHEARRFGWDAEGLDPSLWARKEAKKRFNVKVAKGTFENFKAKPETYDVITMWDVLEHFTEPLEVLHKANRLLKEDGVLALATININSWFSKLLKSHWTWLIRIHLWYFTPKTLSRMLKKAGFEIEWVGGQVRWFSTPYLLSRFTGKNFSWFPEIILPAPTGDIIFVIARKK